MNLAAAGVALAAALIAGVGRAAAAPARPGRAVYVRDAAALIADRTGRARLARAVAAHRISAVIPYGLGPMLDAADRRAALAAWLTELHQLGAEVVAPIADRDRLRALADFAERGQLDGLVSEYEHWNRPDRAAAFAQLLALLAAMRATADQARSAGHAVRVGAYLGYPTADEAAQIAAAVDFVYLDYSVRSPVHAFGHAAHGRPLRERLAWFAGRVEVWPIFYAAGEVDMRAALAADGLDAAEAHFRADLAADRELASHPVTGFVYFTLEAMPAL